MLKFRIAPRWWVVGVFYLSSTLNYLDRQLLGALAPAIQEEFHINNEQYGYILSVFAIVYMLCSPLAGWMLDRLGLNLGSALAVGLWSAAGLARGFTQGLPSLIGAHTLVAVGEAAGIPATGKAAQTYLKQEERALGSSMSQFGLTIGGMLASWLAAWSLAHGGWRSAFLYAGWIGFLWIPLWLWASRKAPVQAAPVEKANVDVKAILGKAQTWGFIGANILSMTIFSLWAGWTVVYFRRVFGLTTIEANQFAPIPQFLGYTGSLVGGAASMLLIRRGWEPLRARRRVCLVAALGMLVTALVPLAGTPWQAVGMIALSSFASALWGVNLYTMPLDAYGSSRAAFAVSLLTAGYGLLMVVISPWIGREVDRLGFETVCRVLAFCPLIGYGLLELTKERK
ncbi:MAG: MFS transporter [Bryobacter sp.]|nr:MFS transporter [Bryobacter sp.]